MQIIEAAPDLICLCREGRIDYVNRAGRGMLGGGVDVSVLGRQFADFTRADYRHVANDLPAFLAEEEAALPLKLVPYGGGEASELLKNADVAMYRAKEHGKANYQFFTADLNSEASDRLLMKNGLIRARERDEFSLHYQPKMGIESGRVTGVETLLRWNSRDLGGVLPVAFIPIMEETGQVVEVGEWVLRTALRQLRAWLDDGLPPITMAVNLSARQLREPSFAGIVETALSDAGVDPEGLEIEITESMLMADYGTTVVALGQLKEMGIRITMDDFGTGYSSLSYLKRFSIDTIKIDRSFASDIATTLDDVEIIKAIITMGQSLNRLVIAEGVETEEQLAILRQNKCDEIQGYLISPPKPAPDLTPLLRDMTGAEAGAQISSQ
jgi:EAL domain-containing protein (putative c-di-GMP-specific phosphodiesterase class I)